MRLQTLLSFDYKAKVYPPEVYRKQFPYVITVVNTSFSFFDYCHLGLKLPTVEDLMEEAGIKESDYLLFGESLSWGWSDKGCEFLYAIALKEKLNSDLSQLIELMWMRWLRDNLKHRVCLTDRYGTQCGGSIERADSEEYVKLHGYFGKPIYPCFVGTSIKENGVTLYKCYKHGQTVILNKQQLVEWIETGEVINASIGKTPLKSGEPRLSINYLGDFQTMVKCSNIF